MKTSKRIDKGIKRMIDNIIEESGSICNTPVKQFDEMNEIEKTIHNEKHIIDGHKRAMELIEKHHVSFISCLVLEDDIIKRQAFIADLEKMLADGKTDFNVSRN